ncbi:UNVERIFIED_CONTAM: hypothetical protein FKN15_059319 [Acipenser sinensis]
MGNTKGDDHRYYTSEGRSVSLPCGGVESSAGGVVEWVQTQIGHVTANTILTRYPDGRVSKGIKDTGGRFELQTDSSLTIHRAVPEDAGSYQCNGNRASELLFLTDDHRYYTSEGRSVSLPCGGVESSAGGVVEWVQTQIGHVTANTILTRHPDGRVSKGIKDTGDRFELQTDSSLTIHRAVPEDAGSYQCNGNRASELLFLTDTLIQGDLQLLKDITYYINTILTRHPDGRVSKGIKDTGDRFELQTDSSLTIHRAVPEDAGSYQCNGNRASELLFLTVNCGTYTLRMNAEGQSQTSQDAPLQMVFNVNKSDDGEIFRCRLDEAGGGRAEASFQLKVKGHLNLSLVFTLLATAVVMLFE